MRFKNELENEIEITILPERTDGISYANIRIAGPDSETMNRITREEAEMLSHELQEFLKG